MSINAVLTQVEKIQFTTGPVTLGYGPGMTVPPRTLVCNAASDITVTLPLTTVTLPLLGQGSNTKTITPGIGAGYLLTILNISSTGIVTIVAATGDTLVDVPVLNAQYTSVDVCSSDTNSTWYRVNQGGSSSSSIFITANVAPPDAALSNGEAALWFDPTNGSPSLNVKAKQTDGTVVTATILLS